VSIAPSERVRQRTEVSHPLDPLDAKEIRRTAAAVRRYAGAAADGLRFVYVTLAEPPKAAVLALGDGGPPPDREARAILRDRVTHRTIEAAVSLEDDTVTSWREVPGVQPPVMMEEFLVAEEVVRADPRWREAMRRRGIEDFSRCMIDPWSCPPVNAGLGPDDGRFLMPLTWVRSGPRDNGYARPVEGLVVFLDLNHMVVTTVEDHGVVPLPGQPGNYSAETISEPGNVPSFPRGTRGDVRPLDIVQPDGPSFTLRGHHLQWQKWDLRIGFTPREGLVLHQISYQDGDRLRPVIYRASLSEMFVPYGDPAPTHYRKLVLDEGEYGVGMMTNSLELGCDCLGEIRYLEGVVNDNDGGALVIPNAICLHEEDAGIAWKHTDFRTGHAEVRRMRRMVISSIVTVGNYEYGYYWYLYQDGTIQYEVKLTGVISTGAVPPGTDPAHGTVVAPGVYGPHHQHFFNVRLDMAVDGTTNRVYEVEPDRLAPGPGNPVGNAWTARETLLRSELEARRRADPVAGRYWKIVNEGARNALGQPTGYRLTSGDNVAALSHRGSPVARRAGFTAYHLWVTSYDPGELHATGAYPNQAEAGGLPAYTAEDRPLVDTDLVVWFTFGTNHVARPEDWPVMPVNPVGFKLVPSGFFAGNPALDIPPPSGCHHSG
jgi:primary-amine oxidase